jgi:hypothetical protein
VAADLAALAQRRTLRGGGALDQRRAAGIDEAVAGPGVLQPGVEVGFGAGPGFAGTWMAPMR